MQHNSAQLALFNPQVASESGGEEMRFSTKLARRRFGRGRPPVSVSGGTFGTLQVAYARGDYYLVNLHRSFLWGANFGPFG